MSDLKGEEEDVRPCATWISAWYLVNIRKWD